MVRSCNRPCRQEIGTEHSNIGSNFVHYFGEFLHISRRHGRFQEAIFGCPKWIQDGLGIVLVRSFFRLAVWLRFGVAFGCVLGPFWGAPGVVLDLFGRILGVLLSSFCRRFLVFIFSLCLSLLRPRFCPFVVVSLSFRRLSRAVVVLRHSSRDLRCVVLMLYSALQGRFGVLDVCMPCYDRCVAGLPPATDVLLVCLRSQLRCCIAVGLICVAGLPPASYVLLVCVR